MVRKGVSLLPNCHMDAHRDLCDVCGKVAFRSYHLAEVRAAELNQSHLNGGRLYSA